MGSKDYLGYQEWSYQESRKRIKVLEAKINGLVKLAVGQQRLIEALAAQVVARNIFIDALNKTINNKRP